MRDDSLANMQNMVDQMDTDQPSAAASKPSSSTAMDEDSNGDANENASTISRICQQVLVDDDDDGQEIWALFEFEIPNPEVPEADPLRIYKKWKRFDSSSELDDFIRRDSGEPLTLPPPSLSPAQSQQIQNEAKQSVSQVTEEFRRFRVRAQVARKQADAQIQSLQNNKIQTTKRRVEGQDLVSTNKWMQVGNVLLHISFDSLDNFYRKRNWNRLEQNMNSWSAYERKWPHKKLNGKRPTIC